MSLSAPWAHNDYLITPYRPFVGSPAKNDRILSECVAHPERFTLPMTRDDIQVTAAAYLTDPNNQVWEVWRKQEFVGVLLLWRIVPQIDALWHFLFFDGDLVGKRELLLAFLHKVFVDLKLGRVSLEVPENVKTLISFARRKLGFRYEGELALAHRTPHPYVNEPATWIARQGSRREHAHFDGETWRDIVLMRLLKDECQ